MIEREEFIKKFEEDVRTKSRLRRFLIAFDQMLNVLIWNGSQDETISSHIARRIEVGRAYKIEIYICKFLRLIESQHCKKTLGE